MDIKAILDALVSHATASSLFDAVLSHEPKNAPGSGITCATWSQELGPAVNFSGQDATAAFIVWNVRLYTSMLQEPQDEIDTNLMLAGSALIAAYSSDFTLGGDAAYIDLLGAGGVALRGRFGYQNIDNKIYRVFNIDVPVVVDSAWSQSP